jgi:hypothetical protein
LAGVVGLGSGLDLATLADNIKSFAFDESEWNERWQRLNEKSGWSFEKSVEKMVALSAFSGKFASVATSTTEVIVDEMSLPTHLKTIRPMDEEDESGRSKSNVPQMFYHNGLLFRVAPSDDPSQHIASGWFAAKNGSP